MTIETTARRRSLSLGQWMTLVVGVAVLAGVFSPRHWGQGLARYRAAVDALLALPAASLLIAHALAGSKNRLAVGRFAWSGTALLAAGVVLVDLALASLVGIDTTAGGQVRLARWAYVAGAVGAYLGMLWLCRPALCPRCGERNLRWACRSSPGETRCEGCDAHLTRAGRGPWALDDAAGPDGGIGWAPGFAPRLERLRRDLRPR